MCGGFWNGTSPFIFPILITNSLFHAAAVRTTFLIGLPVFPGEQLLSGPVERANLAALLSMPWRSFYYGCLIAVLGYYKEY